MLRSLNVYQTDSKTKKLVLGDDGKPIPVKGKGAGQPKARGDMSDDELHYVDVVAKEREDDIAIQRYQARVAREAVLRAAQADLAK